MKGRTGNRKEVGRMVGMKKGEKCEGKKEGGKKRTKTNPLERKKKCRKGRKTGK